MTCFLSMMVSSDRLERRKSLPAYGRDPSFPIVRIQRANPDGTQTRPTTPDWRRFTAVSSQAEPRSGRRTDRLGKIAL